MSSPITLITRILPTMATNILRFTNYHQDPPGTQREGSESKVESSSKKEEPINFYFGPKQQNWACKLGGRAALDLDIDRM